MLRAVLSWKDCKDVVSVGSCLYVGEHFPVMHDNQQDESPEFAVLSIAVDETEAGLQPGFYRLDADLMKLNDALRKAAL